MLNYLTGIGAAALLFLSQLGKSGLFIGSVLCLWPKWRQIGSLLPIQIYRIGVLSLLIVLLSGLFIGMVVALQGYHTLQHFGAAQELGQLVALSVVRELGPVVTALLFAGRAGSAIAAEVGLMRTTEQLKSMAMMAVDPLWRVVFPRFWAAMIALPLLTLLFNVMAIYGGYLVGVQWLGLDAGTFWSNMQSSVSFQHDILNGMIKSVVFAFFVIWIALYQGFYSQPSAAGVSYATTKTVVFSSLMILALDFVLTAVMMGGW